MEWETETVRVALDGRRNAVPETEVHLALVKVWALSESEWFPAATRYQTVDGLPHGIATCEEPSRVPANAGQIEHFAPGHEDCPLWLKAGLGEPVHVDLDGDGVVEVVAPTGAHPNPGGVQFEHRVFVAAPTGCDWGSAGLLGQVRGRGDVYFEWGCHVETDANVSIVVVAGGPSNLAARSASLASAASEVIVFDLEGGRLTETERYPYVYETMADIGATGCDAELGTGSPLWPAPPRSEPDEDVFVPWRVPTEAAPLCVTNVPDDDTLNVRDAPSIEGNVLAELRYDSCIIRSMGAPVGSWQPVVVVVGTSRGPWMLEGWVSANFVSPAGAVDGPEAAAARNTNYVLTVLDGDEGAPTLVAPALAEVCTTVSKSEVRCGLSEWMWSWAHNPCGSYLSAHWDQLGIGPGVMLRQDDGSWLASLPGGLVFDC